MRPSRPIPTAQLAARLSLGTALAVALALLLVGWTYYRPQPSGPSSSVALGAPAQP